MKRCTRGSMIAGLAVLLVVSAGLLGYDAVKKVTGYPGSDQEGARATASRPATVDNTDFYQLCAYGKKGQIAKAIKQGSSVNALDQNGFPPIFHAVLGTPTIYAEGIANIQTALRQDNDTALYQQLDSAPIQEGNFEAVQLLLQNGANVQLRDRNDRSLFTYAALFCSDVRILRALVDAGADHTETLAAQYQQPLLNFASFTNTSPECVAYLAELNGNVGQGNVAAVKALLAKGAKIDMRAGDAYHTELIAAVNRSQPNTEIVRALIRAGADVNARDKDGASVLVYAVWNNHTTDAAKILITAGADKTARYSGKYPYQWCNYYIDDTDVYTTLYNAAPSSYYW